MVDEKVKDIDQIERELTDEESLKRINENFKDSSPATNSEENVNEDDLKEQGLEIYESESSAEGQETLDTINNDETTVEYNVPQANEEPEQQEKTDEESTESNEDQEKNNESEEEQKEETNNESEKDTQKSEEKDNLEEDEEIDDEDDDSEEDETEEDQEKPVQKKVKKNKPKKIIKPQKSKQEFKPIKKIIKSNQNEKKEIKKSQRDLGTIARIKQSEVRRDDKMKPTKHVKKENKEVRKDKSRKEKKSLMWLVWLGLGIVVLAIIIFAIIKLNQPTTQPIVQAGPIAATVNGEPIYRADINAQYNRLDPMMQQLYTKDVLLNQTIDNTLLIQEANRRNIKATKEEIAAALSKFEIDSQLTQEQLEAKLKQQNLTLDYVNVLLEKQIKIMKLFNETILSGIIVSDAEVQAYYNNNTEKYTIPEQVQVQHILILTTENVTDLQAKEKILQINSSLNSTNFCELVTKYSQDPGSVKTCGKYAFSRGEMVLEFELMSFSLKINETGIVKTVYGYHLIKKLDYVKETLQPLDDEIKSKITTAIHDEKAQANFEALLVNLRKNAAIVLYPENTAPVTNTTPTTQNLDAFAKCLTEKNAKFYGASWCSHCANQKTMFGDSLKYVTYVECADAANPQIQTQACTDAKISGYPTWIINGQQYSGEQSLDTLAKLTGCKLS